MSIHYQRGVELLIRYYPNNPMYFVNSCNEPFENEHIINIDTEKNHEWNDATIWNECIHTIIQKITHAK